MSKRNNQKPYESAPKSDTLAPKLVTDYTLRQDIDDTNQGLLQKIFLGLSVIILLWLIVFSLKSGVNADDAFQVDYSEKLVKWYATAGKDVSALDIPKGNMHYYGGFFEVIAGATTHSFGLTPLDEKYHDVRHILIAILGFLSIVSIALLAKEIAGWKAGILALLFATMSPYFFGNALMNPKDIPFCAGFSLGMLGIYMVLKQMPKPQKRFIVCAILGIIMAFGTRAGGLLLIAYFGLFAFIHVWLKDGLGQLFSNKTLLISYLKTFSIIVIAGYFGGLLFWPYGLVKPFTNPFKALSEFESLSIKIRVLFDGNAVMSDKLPWHYPISSILRSIPLYALLGLGLSFPLSYVLWRRYSPLGIFMAFFATIFPVFYVIFKDSILHNGWRHLLFVWPGVVLLATLTFVYLNDWVAQRNPKAALGVWVIAAALMLLPMLHIFKNPTIPYIYYNEAYGGVKGAYGKYETDYWGVSVRQGVEYLKKEGVLGPNMDKVVVASNMVYSLEAYTGVQYGDKLRRAYVRYPTRDEKYWDYAIFPSIFVSGEQIRSGNWPMKSQVVHTVEVDGVPICVVMKQDTSHYTFKAEQAIKNNDLATAMSNFQSAVGQYPDQEEAWYGLANCNFMAQNYPACKVALDKTLTISPVNPQALNLLGQYYLRVNNPKEGLNTFLALTKISDDPTNYYYIATTRAQLGDFQTAIKDAKKGLDMNPSFKPFYQLLAQLYDKIGDKSSAQQYLNMSERVQ